MKYRFVRYRFVRHWFRFVSRPWLDTDIRSKHFVCLQDVFKICLQDLFKTSSRHVFNTSSRRLQRNNSSPSKTSSRCLARCLQDVFKTYLQDVFKTSWKTKNCYAEDVLKTFSRHVLKTSSKRLEDQQMFAGWGGGHNFIFNLVPSS